MNDDRRHGQRAGIRTGGGGRIRISYDDPTRGDGPSLDEIVIERPKLFHLEYLDDNQVWMRIDTGPRQPDIVVVLTAKGKIHASVQED